MRRRRRAEAPQRAGGVSGLCSLLYYVDQFDAADRDETRQCALVHNVVGTARIVASPGPLDLGLVNTLLPNSCFVKKKFAAITVFLVFIFCIYFLYFLFVFIFCIYFSCCGLTCARRSASTSRRARCCSSGAASAC
jgi:hypothetical protein